MANKMWGGRFRAGPDAIMAEINASIGFDRRLYAQDIAGSRAHVEMLARQGIIAKSDAAKIRRGLARIQAEIAGGTFKFSRALEDIHLNIESRLKDLIGPAAGRLHTARSRNDQVAVDFRLYVRDTIDHLDGQLADLQVALAEKALAHAGTIMPGFTHLQVAQPVTFGHHCLAYVEMLARDRSRFADARRRLNECPLGAAALAGTSFPIDRHATAQALGFAGPTRNSLDSVADRDFVLEVLAAAAICATHLSRLAEEIVVWATAQFRFVRLSDKFTTGSSIMPQKRNPDAAELVRADEVALRVARRREVLLRHEESGMVGREQAPACVEHRLLELLGAREVAARLARPGEVPLGAQEIGVVGREELRANGEHALSDPHVLGEAAELGRHGGAGSARGRKRREHRRARPSRGK